MTLTFDLMSEHRSATDIVIYTPWAIIGSNMNTIGQNIKEIFELEAMNRLSICELDLLHKVTLVNCSLRYKQSKSELSRPIPWNTTSEVHRGSNLIT